MSLYRMPSLGADMEAGTLIEWLKKPGDKVARGDIVAVVETQKGAIEIEVFETGVIAKILIEPGTKVPVGTPLAELSNEEAPQASPAPMAQATTSSPPPSPPARPVPPPPPQPAAPPQPGQLGMQASPAARKLAAEHGLDLASIPGTGPAGAIVFVDVERALHRAPAAPPPSTPTGSKAARSPGIDLKEMRKAIAAAMTRSKREIPHYYLSHDVDLEPTLNWLAKNNDGRAPENRMLVGALYIKAVALSLRAHPEFNGFYIDGAFKPAEKIHVGMAVALRGGGLVAPAIHDVDTISLDEVMAKLRDLVVRVRAGRMRGSELADSTITISSLGDRGVNALFGVIYPPQVALVGIGTPQPKPWVLGDLVGIRQIATLTLAADHRVSDGHRGALFLSKIAELMQSPGGV